MSMKFLADEHISPKSVSFPRGLGFEVVHVRAIGLKGGSDEEIMEYATRDDRVLLTNDRDFADIRNYPPGTHKGIIRMRLPIMSPKAVNLCLESLLKKLTQQDIQGNLVITDGEKYRIRKKK